jgi:hypothetical protein
MQLFGNKNVKVTCKHLVLTLISLKKCQKSLYVYLKGLSGYLILWLLSLREVD